MTNPDWTPEEEEAFNSVEKHSNLGKQILKEMGQPYHFDKREWVGLTDDDKESFWTADQMSKQEWGDLFSAVEAKLKEKNS